MRIALVTCARLGGLDPDDETLAGVLAARGADVGVPVWNDPSVDWTGFDVVFLRSTWDYHLQRDAFLAWLESVSAVSRVVHEPALVRWSSHKSYLADLARRGAPVTPTVFLSAAAPVSLARVMDEQGWSEAVFKPAIGLDSFGVHRVARPEADDAQPALDALLAEREVMVQPYVPSVSGYGERCLVVIGGELSHAVRKRSAFLGGRHAGVEGEPVAVAEDERSAAEQLLAAARDELVSRGAAGPIRYARVDLLRGPDEQPRLVELELVEPSLFFATAPGSAERMADVLLGLC